MTRSPISHLRSPAFRRYARPRAGASTSLTSLRFGEIVSGAPSHGYKHPWFTTPAWLPAAQRWGATVNPGFVNAQTPVYRATVAEQVAAGNSWEINPLTGKQFFSAPIFGNQPGAVATKTVDLPLYLTPAIPLDFRALGFDGGTAAPAFFIALGAASSVEGTAPSVLDGGSDTPPPTPPKNLRLLRACDLWINQPRAALTSTFAPGGLGGAPYVQQLGVDTSNAGNPVRILEGTIPPAPPPPDPTQADYTEQTFDQLLISTVYLLSPPNTPLGSEPDSTWQPFVRHNLFWNLNWAQPEFRQPLADVASITFPPLAGGAASLLIGIEQSQIADAQQTAVNILAGTSLAGTFWTPTGGGSSATFTVPATQPKIGPDRTANAAAKIAALLQQQRLAQLDPDFPYNAQPFPTAFLTP